MRSTVHNLTEKHLTALPRRNYGFTLVELLVVIAIIALVMSFIGVAVMSSVSSTRVAATQATITKVHGLLQARIDAATRNLNTNPLTSTLAPVFGAKAAESVAAKIYFRQAFPQTWTEVPTPLLQKLPPIPAIPTSPATTPARQARESAEVLHFLLTKANILGYPPEGEGAFTTSEVQDTDNNGWPEIIDAWGQPIRFYRWPTRLVRGGKWAPGGFTPSAIARTLIPTLPTTTKDLTHDPDDRYGFLTVNQNTPTTRTGIIPVAEVDYYEQGTAPMSSRFHKRGAFNTPETYSVPLIVSAGPDQITGLFEPSDSTTNFGYWGAVDSSQANAALDDITNYSTRSGGK